METGVSLDEAIQISLTKPLSRRTERVSIEEARGRVTAVPLISKVDDPGFDNLPWMASLFGYRTVKRRG